MPSTTEFSGVMLLPDHVFLGLPATSSVSACIQQKIFLMKPHHVQMHMHVFPPELGEVTFFGPMTPSISLPVWLLGNLAFQFL